MTKIWIDAGHGGSDPGACNGQYQEKTYALGMALRLGEVLQTRGYEVLYTRKADKYVGINDRYKAANKAGADLFISIHLNSAANNTAKGIETLCYKMTCKGATLAKRIQEKVIAATGAIDRGVKDLAMAKKTVGVLIYTNMPAALVETGFISNNQEVQKLIDPEYQRKIVHAIADGVDVYLGKTGEEPKPVQANEPEKDIELTTPNDIVWQLGAWGIVDDTAGMLAEMEQAPNGRLYWLARKCVSYIKNHT